MERLKRKALRKEIAKHCGETALHEGMKLRPVFDQPEAKSE